MVRPESDRKIHGFCVSKLPLEVRRMSLWHFPVSHLLSSKDKSQLDYCDTLWDVFTIDERNYVLKYTLRGQYGLYWISLKPVTGRNQSISGLGL